MNHLVLIILLNICCLFNYQEEIRSPTQPDSGPGGATYMHNDVIWSDFAEAEDGYWLFEPTAPQPDSAHVVVFLHGYGAYNTMIYGQWIRHLVQKGNIVIFPRYQKNLFSPSPNEFPKNIAIAIKDALKELEKENRVKPLNEVLSYVGHSYGGASAAYLAVHYRDFDLPKPSAIFLASPGTGPLKGARLDDYKGMDEDLNLLVMVSEDDRTVGDELGTIIFNTTVNTPNRNLILQKHDYHGDKKITAGHNESYSVDKTFDTGVNNFSSKRSLNVGKLDAVDFYGYWKLFDALLDCTRTNANCEYAFGNTPEQKNMGKWSDGKAVKKLKITLPTSAQ